MLASIDVGSNTIRLLVGDVVEGKIKPRIYKRRITRLKGGQTGEGLAPEAMERTFAAVHDFIEIAGEYNVSSLRIVGTEALRTAANGQQFAARVLQTSGCELEIIDGQTEAELSSMGVLAALTPMPETCMIVDIGGGSTEFALVANSKVLFRESCPLGVVRLAEMVSERDRELFIADHMGRLSKMLASAELFNRVIASSTKLIGTAGTITTLAAIDMRMGRYDWQLVNNYQLSSDGIEAILSDLQPLAPIDRERIVGMEKGRGDLIVPGILILQSIMHLMSKKSLIVSDFGLLEGLLVEMAKTAADR